MHGTNNIPSGGHTSCRFNYICTSITPTLCAIATDTKTT